MLLDERIYDLLSYKALGHIFVRRKWFLGISLLCMCSSPSSLRRSAQGNDLRGVSDVFVEVANAGMDRRRNKHLTS